MINGRAYDVTNESNIWVLEIVRQLKDMPLIDTGRLDYIQKTLEKGHTLYQTDKKYLQEKFHLLEKIADEKRKTNETLQSLNKLHQSRLKDIQILEKLKESKLQNFQRTDKSTLNDYEKFDAIKKPLQEIIQVTENEISFLDIRHEKLKQEISHQDRIQWTIEFIKRLYKEEIGDYRRLEKINTALEDGKSIGQSEIDYLKEKYVILQQIDTHKKVQWTIGMIDKLQESEIGNYERLEEIKAKLEKGDTADPREISYLKEKFNQILIIKKSKPNMIKNDVTN